MTVEEFNTDKGLYIFEINDFETEFHSHPAMEIILSVNGVFTLWTETAEYQNLKFAVIEANQKHKLSSADCKLKVTMIEYHNKFVTDILYTNGICTNNGFHFQASQGNEEIIIQEIVQGIKDCGFISEYDQRISLTIDYLNNNDLEYVQMIRTLKGVTNLSESRLSHLFKINLGISLKRYLVWTKLKSTIKQRLNKQDNLFSSLFKSGFYDQPHFSRNFKAMLGVNASKVYNSRTLQVSPILIP